MQYLKQKKKQETIKFILKIIFRNNQTLKQSKQSVISAKINVVTVVEAKRNPQDTIHLVLKYFPPKAIPQKIPKKLFLRKKLILSSKSEIK